MYQDGNNVSLCEACRRRQASEVISGDDPHEPYKVCSECGERLRQRALRPLEWFNLAAKHGWRKYLLRDDFYDEDGTAQQPDIESYCVDGMLAPKLDEAMRSL